MRLLNFIIETLGALGIIAFILVIKVIVWYGVSELFTSKPK